MFGGGGSIQVGRIFGIRISVAPSWFVVLFILIWSLSGYYGDLFPGEGTKSFVLAVLSSLLFFLSVLLHELGHAVVALRNGITIRGIELWMFGGLATMERDSESPGVEFRVAAAGPAVTLVIAAVCFGLGTLISGSSEAANSAVFDAGTGSDEAVAVLGYLTLINATVLVFNLIPGYPLDGGRIARSIAWKVTGDRNRATRFAAVLGRVFSWLLILGGVAWFLITGDLLSGLWFVFIGMFLGQAARGAGAEAALSTRLEGLRAADVMDDEPVVIPEDLSLDRAEEEFFLRYRYPWFPVVDAEGRFVGLVTQHAIEDLPDAVRAGRTVASIMARGDDQDLHLQVGIEDSLESLLRLDGLNRLGALMAVDADGRLRGIVTADRVRRALAAA